MAVIKNGGSLPPAFSTKLLERWLLLLLMLLIPVEIFANPLQLPKTGQKSCYDSAGNSIACLGTGQDGDIQSGKAWPQPRFIDNGDQTVTDQLTGLVWSKDANVMATRDPSFDNRDLGRDGAVYWQMALDYAKKLNSEKFLGFSDWRLPNAIELESLVDADKHLPALPADNPFLNVQQIYWSSSIIGNNLAGRWTVPVGLDGRLFGFGNSYSYYVWPVRGATQSLLQTGETICADEDGVEIACAGTGQDGDIRAGVTPPVPRFTDNNDGTITDTATELIWTKDANVISTRNANFDTDGTAGDGLVNWQHALDYVAKLNAEAYLGYNDWRLPNVNELASLADLGSLNPSLPTGHPFQDLLQTNNDAYWSSTTNSRFPAEGFAVFYDVGAIRTSVGKTTANGVWPVRGSSVIKAAPTSLDFAALLPGGTSSGVTFISNLNTKSAVTLVSLNVYGANAGDFTIVPGEGSDNRCSTTTVLSPGDSCTVEVTFTPSGTGPRSAVLRVLTDDGNSPVQSVPLSGFGATPIYPLSFLAGPNGNLTGTATQSVLDGSSSTPVMAIPDPNYHFVNWTGTNGFASSANPLVIQKVTSSQTYTANYAINTYTVTPTSGAGGSISPANPQAVDFNGTVSFTIIPDSGFTIASVTGCGGSLSGSTYKSGSVVENCAVEATFAPIAHDGIINPAAGKTAPDIGDAVILLRHLAGLTTLSSSQILHADVAPLGSDGKPNPDGKLDIADVIILLQRVVGLTKW